MNSDPTPSEGWMVSVLCFVYNQKDYVRDCLDSVVTQQAAFPFRAVVHDDGSDDGTADIVREYAQRYPDIVIPIFRDRKLNNDVSGAVYSSLSRGKYLALCDGDDYWTDPLKLQRQVDFMEAHPDYAICYHEVMNLYMQTGEQRPYDHYGKDVPEDADLHDLCRLDFHMPTCATLFRASALDFAQIMSFMPVLNLDSLMQYQAATHGRIKRLPQTMAVYRIGTGFWTTLDKHSPKLLANRVKILSYIRTMMPSPALRAEIDRTIEWHISDCDQFQTEQKRYIHALENSRPRQLGLWILHPISMLRKMFIPEK